MVADFLLSLASVLGGIALAFVLSLLAFVPVVDH